MCALRLGMGLSLFFLWLLNKYGVSSCYSFVITVLYWIYWQSNKSLTHMCCLTEAVFFLQNKRGEISQSTEEKTLHCHNRLYVFRTGFFLLTPSALHTAPQSPTANIPQTKINVVSLWVKSLNKQKYQQSASSLCPWVGHNRLFVRLKL